MPSPNYKQLILAVLAVVLGFFTFWSWQKLVPALAEGEFRVGSFIYPITGLVFAAFFFVMIAIFIKKTWLTYLAALASVVPAYFLLRANSATVWALLATIFLIVLALHRIRHEMELSIGFSLSKILKSGLPLYFTAASLVLSVFYFETARSDERKLISSIFPKPVSTAVLKLLSGQLGPLVGFPIQLRPEATVDELMSQFIKGQLEQRGVSVVNLPKKELDNLLALQLQELTKRFNLPTLTGREKLADVFYEAISGQITKLGSPIKNYLPLFSAFAFFFAFKTFTLPLYYITLLVTFLLLKLAIFAKIIRKEKAQIEVERLAL